MKKAVRRADTQAGPYTSPAIPFTLIVATMIFFAHVVFAQTGLEKMIVGYSAQAGAYAPIWITKEAGLFKKNGLDVNLIFIPGGPTAAAAMIANEVQAMAMAGPAIVASNLAGSDLVMTAGIVNTFALARKNASRCANACPARDHEALSSRT